MKIFSIENLALYSFIVFIVLAIFVKGNEPSTIIIALLSVSTFLFGIFGAFIMQDRYARLNNLRSTLRTDDSLYINIYKLSGVFGKNVRRRTQKLIDNYITKTIDLKLIDYNKASKEFLALYDYIINIKPRNSKQTEVYGELLDCIDSANSGRESIGYLIRNNIQKFEWFSLIGLLGTIIFAVFYMNDNSIPFIIISILVSTTSVILLLVIRELDNLRWKEKTWIWEPLEDLFSDLDLLPYFPEEVITSVRANIKKGRKVRIITYPRPYPDFTGKKVIIKKF